MIETISGKVTDLKTHFESHGGGENATLHTKIWIKLDSEDERYFHFKNIEIEIKTGHKVLFIVVNDDLKGYINLNSSKSFNLSFYCSPLHWLVIISVAFLFINGAISSGSPFLALLFFLLSFIGIGYCKKLNKLFTRVGRLISDEKGP